MVTYKILNVASDCYDPEHLEKMSLLYKGGYQIMESAQMFMKKLSIESMNSYKERLQCTSYLPYMSQFIDNFSSSLFSDDLRVKEAADADDPDTLGGVVNSDDFYKLFSSNADLMNNSFHNLMKDTFTESLYSKCAYLGLDFKNLPEGEDLPENLLEEEDSGLSRAYMYDIDPASVIDWKFNPLTDKFMWVKIRNEVIIQDDPLLEAMKKVQFKIWKMNGPVAHWDLYESKPIKLNQEFKANDDIPLIDSGDTSFGEIPIFELKIPEGLHLGNKIGPICEELFQRRSFLVSNMNKTCIAIPVVLMGDEIGAPGESLGSEVQQNPNRANALRNSLSSQGYVTLGAKDKVEIVEAHGHSHGLVDKQITELREQMHQVVHQMAQSVTSNKMALGRSGVSKMQDRHATEIVLSAYARIVKDFVKDIYKCISQGRGESIVWSVQGLSTFVEEDRQVLIEEMVAVSGAQPILSMLPSDTFHKKYLLRLAMAMVGTMSPEEEATIQQELEDAVVAGEHMPPVDPNQVQAGGRANKPKLSAASDDAQPLKKIGDIKIPSEKQVTPGDDTMALGPAGHPLMPQGSHLQTGEHISGQTVFDHLATDYEEKDIQWVLSVPWIGPVEVELSDIDFSNMDNWQATKDQEHVDDFAEKVKDGMTKPIVLVNNKSNDNKYQIVDGHHRALAHLQEGTPIPAYIGEVSMDKGPWSRLHDQQVGKKGEGSGSKQKSNQMNESSIQKEASQQVAKSEKAVGGKTK
jgi:ParB-like nuclease domain